MKHYGDITKLHGWDLPVVDLTWLTKNQPQGKGDKMKVKDIVSKYSMASNASVIIKVTDGETKGDYLFSKNGINELLENNAPILNKKVGLIYVIDNTLTISAR